jgi:hypothetical protein
MKFLWMCLYIQVYSDTDEYGDHLSSGGVWESDQRVGCKHVVQTSYRKNMVVTMLH